MQKKKDFFSEIKDLICECLYVMGLTPDLKSKMLCNCTKGVLVVSFKSQHYVFLLFVYILDHCLTFGTAILHDIDLISPNLQ